MAIEVEDRPTALSLKIGETAVIEDIKKNELTSRLLTLGIVPEKTCRIVAFAPFGGAGILALENHHIALRLEELSSIYIRKIKPADS